MSVSSLAVPERLSWALAGTAVVSALAFWRTSFDVFGYPKLAVLVLGVAVTVAMATHDAVVTGRLDIPWAPATWAAMTFAGLILAVFLTRPTILSFVGASSRHTGALFYISVAAAGLLMMRAAGEDDVARWRATRTLALGVVVAGGLVGIVGMLQLLGADPLDRVGATVVTATFNNPNFAAAFVGVTVPAAAWAIWDRGHGLALRAFAGLALAVALGTAFGTRSVQGPVTAAVGLLVFVLAVILGIRDERVRKTAVAGWGAVTVLAGTLGALSLMGRGPFGALADAANVELRSFYWAAGLRMFADEPLTGVGMERYRVHFGEFRSEAAAARLDLDYAVDAAHNVPIHLFATGGALVGLAYIGFVVATAVALVLAFRRTAGRPRLLVGALGGIWVGYQAQSLISIETAPLALLHWLSAGAIVAWSGTGVLRTIDLPWSSGRKQSARGRARVSAAVLCVGLVGLFAVLLIPLRAGTAVARGVALADAEREGEAVQELEEATSQAPWEPLYWQRLGAVSLGLQRAEAAEHAYERALDAEPRSIIALITAARIADAQGEVERAAELYERALEVAPLAPTLLNEVADFLEQQGERDRAAELRERAEGIVN